jgi:lipopolysaccharide transport protein LptA
MLAIIVAVVVSVALTLRTPPKPIPDGVKEAVASGGLMTKTDWEVHPLKQGEGLVLRAKKAVFMSEDEIRLQGVDFQFPYKFGGQTVTAELTSDEGVYRPTTRQADLCWSVKLKTADGFTLDSESLIYDGERQIIHSDAPFTFARDEFSGSGHGFVYDVNAGTIRILDETRVLAKATDGDTVVKSLSATYNRNQGQMRFIGAKLGDVSVTQRGNVLDTEELVLYLDTEHKRVVGAQALRESRLRMAGAQAALGAADQSGGSGERILTGERLDIWFQDGRKLQKVLDHHGELAVYPGADDKPEIRRLLAESLQFSFDTEGRFTQVEAKGPEGARLTSEPVKQPGRKLDASLRRSLRCHRLTVDFDPTSGQMLAGDFADEVVFVAGARQATAGHGQFKREGARSVLTLEQNPELVDADQGSRLRAETMAIDPDHGDLTAQRNVRHVLRPRRTLAGAPPEETVVTARDLHYTSSAKEAVYRGDVLMRLGTDELRAAEIRVAGPDGARRLQAKGDVVSLLTPRGKEKDKDGGALDARAREMVWDESARRVDYTGDVVMRQRDFEARSPTSVVYLTSDNQCDRIESGDPVVVEQSHAGRRTHSATGAHGTYRLASRTFTLTGPDVEMRDADGQSVHGRSLTFRSLDDSVHIDGRGEARTETVLRPDRALP